MWRRAGPRAFAGDCLYRDALVSSIIEWHGRPAREVTRKMRVPHFTRKMRVPHFTRKMRGSQLMIMIILETERLILRHMSPDTDAAFVIELLNQPSFVQYIGDKGVRTLEDARQYIVNGPLKSYEQNGFGLYTVELKANGAP